jgi:hypothetical protein
MDITVITPTLARLTDITAPHISIAAFLSAPVRGSIAAITGQVTVLSDPILIEGSMAVRDSATSVAAGSAAASVVDSGAAINSTLVVGSGAASLVAAGDVNRRKWHRFCKRLALMPAVFFQIRQLDSYPRASKLMGRFLTAN